ncbi:MAG TPA: hypothetical protein VGW57_09345 [Chthoniobacterales bacterium]|nr:hypothetical protein [Chthoniobacterales bacterium]
MTIPAGYKILCGGAQVSPPAGGRWGNFLTASYPPNIFAWTALAKDQDNPAATTITAYAIALNDPNDQYDVQIFTATSVPSSDTPTVSVSLPPGYRLVGGGAQANYGSAGQFLITSAPLADLSGWQASSRWHLHSDPGTVIAFAIGIRLRAGAASISTKLFHDTTANPQSRPEEDVGVGPGYSVIGGGASVSMGFATIGNLLTASYPKDLDGLVEWQVSSRDQDGNDPEIITAYAIGAMTGT